MTSVKDMLDRKGRDVWTIDSEASVEEALSIMGQQNIGALLVYRGEELVGLLSERDYARKSPGLGRLPRELVVRELMSDAAVSVEEATSVSRCMKLMLEHRVRHLPVMGSGRVVGLVSIGDVVNSVIQDHQSMIRHLEDYIAGLR
jgi:CBS domain-containing protein